MTDNLITNILMAGVGGQGTLLPMFTYITSVVSNDPMAVRCAGC